MLLGYPHDYGNLHIEGFNHRVPTAEVVSWTCRSTLSLGPPGDRRIQGGPGMEVSSPGSCYFWIKTLASHPKNFAGVLALLSLKCRFSPWCLFGESLWISRNACTVQVSLLNEHHSANSIKLKLARRCGWWNCAIAMWKKTLFPQHLGAIFLGPYRKNMVPTSRRPPWVRNMVSFSLGWTQRWQGDGLQWSWRHDQSEFIEISRHGWRIWHHFFSLYVGQPCKSARETGPGWCPNCWLRVIVEDRHVSFHCCADSLTAEERPQKSYSDVIVIPKTL